MKYLTRASLILLLLMTFISVDCSRKKPEQKPEDVKPVAAKSAPEYPAPDFQLMDLDGNEVRLSDYEGKVVLLNFWASWCGPCRREIPDFIELYDEYQSQGFEILGIALNSGSVDEIKNFAENSNINYTILTGDERYLAGIAAKYENIRSIPTTFLIDRNGGIQKKWVGMLTKSAAQAEINKHL